MNVLSVSGIQYISHSHTHSIPMLNLNRQDVALLAEPAGFGRGVVQLEALQRGHDVPHVTVLLVYLLPDLPTGVQSNTQTPLLAILSLQQIKLVHECNTGTLSKL